MLNVGEEIRAELSFHHHFLVWTNAASHWAFLGLGAACFLWEADVRVLMGGISSQSPPEV